MPDNTNTNSNTPNRTRSANGWMISTIVFAVLFLTMTIVTSILAVNLIRSKETITYEAMASSEKSTEEILADDLEVSYEDDFFYEVNEEEDYFVAGQTIIVTNKSDERHSFSIHFEAVNEDGSERIAEDNIAIERLAPGQSEEENIFTNITQAQAEKLKDATFQIVEVTEY